MRLTALRAIAVPALLAACGTAPRVEIVEAVPMATIGTEQEWALVLRVHNPKDAQLVLDGWTLDAGGRRIEWVATRTVPPREMIQESLPVVLPSSVGAWSVSGELSYVAPGRLNDILFDSGFSRPSVSFAGTPTIKAAGSAPAPTAVDGTMPDLKAPAR
ncbi:MAG: hypothetical protein DWH90_01370 [Planctomycetota bacterium]|nr:MAG: hypothetical protein DWH90_01370 [Planctomycetota bacterium]